MRNTRSNIKAFLMLLLAGGAGTADAGVTVQGYPWWDVPIYCLTDPKRASQPECIVDDWPSYEETEQRVALLFQGEFFPYLEKAFGELVTSPKAFPSGKTTASAVYAAFRLVMPAPGAPPDAQTRITHWKTRVSDSRFVEFAEARYLYASAWNIRGSGYAGSVSQESWELFAIRLREAEQKLLAAPQAVKDTPLWDQLLFAIALDSKTPQTSPQRVFENAVKRWPAHFDFYEVMLTRLVPKWGGSWNKVEAFIDHWSRQRESTEGKSLYARLYVSLLSEGVTPNETAMDWPRMRSSFDDLIARYPDPRFKNLYASYACFSRDKSAFNKAMGLLPAKELRPANWLPGHSYEACIRWAGV